MMCILKVQDKYQPETVHIQGIIGDSPTGESSLPNEEYRGYTQISAEWSPLQGSMYIHLPVEHLGSTQNSPGRQAQYVEYLQLNPSQDCLYKTRRQHPTHQITEMATRDDGVATVALAAKEFKPPTMDCQ